MSAADLLVSAWDERDRRYQTRRSTGYGEPVMSPVEADAVRIWRKREAEALSEDIRPRAMTEWADWQVPTFTNVRY